MEKKSSVDYTKKEIYIMLPIVFAVASALAFIVFTLLEYQTTTSLLLGIILGLACILPIVARLNAQKPYTIKRRIIVGLCGGLLIGALLLVLMRGIEPGVTLEQYNSIETGMQYEEVKEIFKSDGEIMWELDLGDPETASYTVKWKGKSLIGANCVLTFQGDKLTSKVQSGL